MAQTSDFLVDKYKTLLNLKEHGSFQKGPLSFFADSRQKPLGSVLFTRDGRVITKILLFLAF